MRYALVHSGRWRGQRARPCSPPRAVALALAVVASAAFAAGCSGGATSTAAGNVARSGPTVRSSPTAGGPAADNGPAAVGTGPIPEVVGKFGTDPRITIPRENPPTSLVVRTLVQGDGQVVGPDDYVIFNVAGKVWVGSRQVVDSFKVHSPQGLPLGHAMPAWRQLAGQRVGSRVLMVVPPKDGFGPQGNTAAEVTATDTLVLVFDVLAAMPADAAAPGAAGSYNAGPGLPAIRWGAQGPVITIPAATKPPDKLISRLIARGTGPPITTGQTVTVQDTGVVWRTGQAFDSTWHRGFPESFVLGTGQVIPGWERGMGGLPVGSRVLLIVPPSMGFGTSGYAPYVNATDTMVFVVDIVSAVGPG